MTPHVESNEQSGHAIYQVENVEVGVALGPGEFMLQP